MAMLNTNGLQGHRLLIVDDEPVIAATLSVVFRKHGFSVETVGSAETALQLIQHWVPEIAILDVCLPGMNGIELALLLTTTLPDCKLILFSGSPDTAELITAAGKKAHRFEILPKPIPPELLLERAAKLLETEATGLPLSAPDRVA